MESLQDVSAAPSSLNETAAARNWHDEKHSALSHQHSAISIQP
jgi:hypothetical protein